MSTAFHLQMDGQTERINQVIEAYLQSYCNYEWNNWAEMLWMAEYADNNSKHSATKISPFYANYGYEPSTTWSTKVNFKSPASEMFGHYMREVQKKLSENLEKIREAMGKYYNKKRRTIEDCKKGEFEILNGKNIRYMGRCRKLEDMIYEQFKITSVGHNNRYYKLELPSSRKIHQTFDISLLKRYRRSNPGKPVILVEADDAG